MTNEETAQEISEKYKRCNVECSSLDCYLSALEMAKRKDSQPKIIEILGKRVKVVEDESHTMAVCYDCAFCYFCKYTLGIIGELCESASHGINRHFVEVDEDGNEIKKEQKQTI